MPFAHGTEVWKNYHDQIWVGRVVGYFRKFDGVLYAVMETKNKSIFVSEACALRPMNELEHDHAA